MRYQLSALLLLALLLTACQSALLTDLTTASGDKLFWDDFFSPEPDSWPEMNDPNGTLGLADGAYRMTVTTPNYQTWAVPGQAYRDVRIEADVVRNAGPLINIMGLVCRYQDGDNFYFFIISSDGYYGLGKVQSGQLSLVGQQMMIFSASILQDTGNHMRFDCTGSSLTGYINGQMVAKSEDTAFRDGDAGFTAGTFDEGGVDVSFDNFVVYKP